MKDMENIQQIRFVNGMEAIANILHWDEDTNIEVNYLLQMDVLPDYGDDLEEDRSFYILRPMVSYTDDLTKATTVNPASVMTVSDPSPTVIKQYKNSIHEITSQMSGKEEDSVIGNVIAFNPKKSPQMLTED
jgi:hypothetical protein